MINTIHLRIIAASFMNWGFNLYTKCAICENLGVTCWKVNILSMTTPEIIEFLKQRKKFLGVSNQKIAEGSNVPVGTVSRVFSFDPQTDKADFKFDTLRRIAAFLMGYSWSDEDCPVPPSDDIAAQTIAELEAENCKLKALVESAEQRRLADIEAAKATDKKVIELLENRVAYLQSMLRYNKLITLIFGAMLAVSLVGFMWVK